MGVTVVTSCRRSVSPTSTTTSRATTTPTTSGTCRTIVARRASDSATAGIAAVRTPLGTYTNYVRTLGTTRRTLVKNQVITLDSLSAHPVRSSAWTSPARGIGPAPSDENSLCLMLKVSYGEFDDVFGGDLTGGAEEVRP